MKKIFLKDFSYLLLVICLTLLFGLPTSSAKEKDKILIGVVEGLTGWSQDLGASAKEGINLAVEEVNKKGGILGKTVDVIFRDHESNPTKGITVVRELIFKDKVDVIIGPTYTNVNFAILPVINEAKIVHLTLGTGTFIVNPEKNPYTFRFNFYSKIEAERVVDYALNKKKFDQIAIFSDASAYGKAGLAELTPLLRGKGINPVAVESYNVGDKDMTGQLLKIKNAGAKAIITWGLGPDIAIMVKNMLTLGMDLPVYGGAGLNQRAFQILAGDAGKNVLGVVIKHFTFNNKNPLPDKSKRFMDELTKRYGLNRSSFLPTSAQFYDTVYVYAKAVGMAQSTQTEKVKASLEKLSYEGLTSNFVFTPKDHEGVEIKELTLGYSAGMIPEGALSRPEDID
jgi:branched-chain amino acid transport system substrate-binding protein